MVIDVDDRRVRRDLLDAAARPLEVAGVEEEHQLRISAGRRLLFDLFEPRQERVHLRQWWRYHDPCVLAGRSQRLGKGEAAAQCVSVGVLVPEDQDLLVGFDEIPDLVVLVSSAALRGSYVFSSSVAGRTSFSNSQLWTPYSLQRSRSTPSARDNLR